VFDNKKLAEQRVLDKINEKLEENREFYDDLHSLYKRRGNYWHSSSADDTYWIEKTTFHTSFEIKDPGYY
jgi:hypothetical protein